MSIGNNRSAGTILFNPFGRIAGVEALGIGVGAILVAGWIGALSHTHFDGVLDTHTGMRVPLGVFLGEGVIDWVCMAVVLLVFGRMISKTKFRTIDVLGTQALARWPAILISLVTLPGAVERVGNELVKQALHPGGTVHLGTAEVIVFGVSIAAMIVLICWVVALMYKAYSVSCNVKGGAAVGTFIGGIIVAEVLSKVGIGLLLKLG
jgi:hypothetical protein